LVEQLSDLEGADDFYDIQDAAVLARSAFDDADAALRELE